MRVGEEREGGERERDYTIISEAAIFVRGTIISESAIFVYSVAKRL